MLQNTSTGHGFLGEVRRIVRVHLLGRFKRACGRLVAALAMWVSPEANPFLARTLRLETRRHRPLLTLAGFLALAVIANIGAWKLLNWLQLQNRALLGYQPHHLPPALGHNAIGFTALLTAGVAAYSILFTCRNRAAGLLRSELFKSTLPQLQLLPIQEERWLWLMSAHPAALAVLIGLAGLPIYLLAVFTNLWHLSDIAGLLLVFLMIGHAAPIWQPILWKQKAKGTAKTDWKAVQARIKELNKGVKLSEMTAAQRMEHQRRVQRALGGFDDDGPSVEKDDKDGKGTARSTPANWKRSNQRPGWARGLSIYFLVQFGFRFLFSGLRGGGGIFSAVAAELKHALPADVSSLAPSIIISWPLMLARLIWVPLPFLSFALPPVILLVPLVVTMRRQGNLALASQVSAAETFWTTRRLRHRRSFYLWSGFLALLLIFGYSWHTLVPDGEAANLLPGALPAAGEALAALWTVALAVGALAAAWSFEYWFNAANRGELSAREAWGKAARAGKGILAATLAFYFGLCWLGGYSGGSDLWLSRFTPTLATSFAFGIAVFGSAALGVTLKPPMRTVWKAIRGIWFWYFPLEAGVRYLYNLDSGAPFTFAHAPYLLFSPFISLFSLFRFDLSSTGVPWWLGPLLQTCAGAYCIARAMPLIFQRTDVTAEPYIEVRPWWQRLLDAALWPFRVIYRFLKSIRIYPIEVFLRFLEAVYKAIAGFFRAISARFKLWDEAIVRRGERFDNAVLTGELRARARRMRWSIQWLLVQLVGISILLFAGQPWSLRGTRWVPAAIAAFPPGWGATGLAVNSSWVDWGSTVVYICMFVAWVLAVVSVADIGRSFDRDRANGTLVFLFLTSMTDEAILFGKVWPSLIHGMAYLAAVLPPLVIGSLVALAGGTTLPLIAGIIGFLVALSTLCFIAAVHVAFAVRAVKSGEGSFKAVLVGFGLDATLALAVVYLVSFDYLREIQAPDMCALLVLLALIHSGAACVAWRVALWSMRRQRYGDVTALGKGVA